MIPFPEWKFAIFSQNCPGKSRSRCSNSERMRRAGKAIWYTSWWFKSNYGMTVPWTVDYWSTLPYFSSFKTIRMKSRILLVFIGLTCTGKKGGTLMFHSFIGWPTSKENYQTRDVLWRGNPNLGTLGIIA